VTAALLHCPIRGPLTARELARDGLTPTEEARRIDLLHFLLDERHYPAENIAVGTFVLPGIGNKGKKQFKADVIAYDAPAADCADAPAAERLHRVTLVAGVKREAKFRQAGIEHQLRQALFALPSARAVGIYWGDQNRDLLVKELVKEPTSHIRIRTDVVANLPDWGQRYRLKPITVQTLTAPENLVGVLFGLANIMRSHGVNDEQLRYRETVKLLLARHVDERQAKARPDGVLKLQIYQDRDPGFMGRIRQVYLDSADGYSKARTLFHPIAASELDERVLRSLIGNIQGLDFSSATTETMQQIFMSFVPAVFKKVLSQYFTPVSLIEAVVAMVDIGPADKIADPAMGTADFLTAAIAARPDDEDIIHRVFGIDSDEKAFDLAVVNMILNRDGESGLICEDSIRSPSRWQDEMNVVLCNPPFGARTVETSQAVLKEYDLGHLWKRESAGNWTKTDDVLDSQQLGILFIERCWKMLLPGGRLGIILPEGYLSTPSHGYVRRWILDHFQVVALVELPRRIFLKSDVDLRSNILIARKPDGALPGDYPIYASLVRKVGYKLGGNFAATPLKDPESGHVIRNNQNQIVLESDFHRTLAGYRQFKATKPDQWTGARYTDIAGRADLDMKPRRLVPRALSIVRKVQQEQHVRLADVAEVILDTVDLIAGVGPSMWRRPVEGQDIRAIEGLVSPQFPERCWSIAERKDRHVYILKYGDIIVGLVRPERRNTGILLDHGDDIVGIRDALAVVRVRPECAADYPQEWLFAALRSEEARIQFWTESGGTSYGKLTLDDIGNVLLPADASSRHKRAEAVRTWMDAVEAMQASWRDVGDEDDRRPILNSPLIGLVNDDPEDGSQCGSARNED
jgi:type I restriction enzyme M protein